MKLYGLPCVTGSSSESESQIIEIKFLNMFQKMATTVISVIQVLDSEYELVTRGSPYSFDVMNSPVTGHLGKMFIRPNW